MLCNFECFFHYLVIALLLVTGFRKLYSYIGMYFHFQIGMYFHFQFKFIQFNQVPRGNILPSEIGETDCRI